MSSYDVVVAGAGPAGSMAAYYLAGAGARVVLLEKERMPRRKPCGGGLSGKAYRDFPFDLAPLVKSRCREVELRACGERRIVRAGAQSVWMVCRPEFDLFLAEHAVAAGAEFQQEQAVIGFTQGNGVTIETPSATLRAQVLIAADGANGFVSRHAGLRPKDAAPFALAIEAEAPVEEDRWGSRAMLDFDYARGYAWIFPKDQLCNVGVFTTQPDRFAALKQDFHRFISQLDVPFCGEIRSEARKIPFGGWRGNLVSGRVLAVGDAGGLSDPFLGEGIAFALHSGRIAAESVMQFLSGESQDLIGYERGVQESIGVDLRALRRTGALFYQRPRLWIQLISRLWPLQKLGAAYVAGRWSWGGGW